MRLTFVFKIKVHADRSLDKFKARLCVVGTGQVQGEDYWESYSSTARTTSVKLVVILTTVEDWIDFHFDLHDAFLTADIDADVYTDQPAGVEPVRYYQYISPGQLYCPGLNGGKRLTTVR